TEKGCVPCHSIGIIWEDGSKGRCDTCHTRHTFSAEEASKPESCGTCHTGDHPHYEMWENSKHGMLYSMGSERAPTCVTCHDSHEVITAWGFLGLRPGDQDDPEWYKARQKIVTTMETMGPALAPEVMRDSYEEWETLREDMIDRCEMCHSESFARRELEKGDDLLRESDIAMAHLIDLANVLYDIRVIDDKTRFSIYREGTAHRFSTFMGGFHNSAKYAWDEGYLALAQTLIGERDAAIAHVLNIAGVVLGVIGIILISWYWYKNRA
ncbi:MAG: multiheme c-type cytochrome, partial [Candidatus Bathyarchaeota archaeon]